MTLEIRALPVILDISICAELNRIDLVWKDKRKPWGLQIVPGVKWSENLTVALITSLLLSIVPH